MKNIFLIAIITIILVSCKKDQDIPMSKHYIKASPVQHDENNDIYVYKNGTMSNPLNRPASVFIPLKFGGALISGNTHVTGEAIISGDTLSLTYTEYVKADSSIRQTCHVHNAIYKLSNN